MSRLVAVALFALIGVALGPNAAVALGHVTLGKHSQTDIKNHCDAAGGSFYNSEGVYGCFGPGGDVTCTAKSEKCFGTCEKCSAQLKAKGEVFATCKECTAESVSATLGQPPKEPAPRTK